MIGIVASRLVERYSRPVVLIAGTDGDWKGSGPFDLRPSTCTAVSPPARSTSSASAATAPPPASRSARRTSTTLAEAFAAYADEHLADDDLRPVTRGRRDRPRRGAARSACARELRRLAPFGLGNPGVNLLVAGCELTDLRRSATGKHLRFRVSDSRPAAGTRDRLRPRRAARPLPPRRPLRHRLPPPGEHLERDDLAAARRPPDLRDARPLRRAARALRRASGAPAGSVRRRRAIAEELGLEHGGPWRSLLESRDLPGAARGAVRCRSPPRRARRRQLEAARASSSALLSVTSAQGHPCSVSQRFFLRRSPPG